ncbi:MULTISPECIES: hypothetical protein [Methylobacteriaceae]|uniref:hypothetical protein n=1 Tax=Methylobacteriaceae TaxID=119045 RepID=UPI0012FF6059|nr:MULTISPECIES: hypothetical protein [Methylobacteriaceae]MBY0252004.1 hypothetical protein [Methylobacterium organophilum]MDV2984063.1 hypothetical protein [Methylobacteriaceae bacterium AG10]
MLVRHRATVSRLDAEPSLTTCSPEGHARVLSLTISQQSCQAGNFGREPLVFGPALPVSEAHFFDRADRILNDAILVRQLT